MAYQVFHGEPAAMLRRDEALDERVRTERFSNEREALNRAREILDRDFSNVVVVPTMLVTSYAVYACS